MYDYLVEDCSDYPEERPANLEFEFDDIVNLAAHARECGIEYESSMIAARVFINAIAKGYFTVVREYEHSVDGISVTLSPSQWETWASTGELPKQDRTLAQIDEVIIRLSQLRQVVQAQQWREKAAESIPFGDFSI